MKRVKRMKRGMILITSLVILSAVFFSSYLLGLGFLIGGLIAFVVLFGLIYFWWAPNNLFYTFVKEGTVKIVVLADKVIRILIQWKGYTLDKDWNVKEGEEQHILGGLRRYGWWPIYDIYIHTFSWTGIAHNGELKHHKEEIHDYVMLKDDIYWGKVEKAEDKDLLPLDVELLFTIRIVNPYKALFRVDDWLQTVINRSSPAVRDYITGYTFNELIKMPEAMGEEIFKDLKERKILDEEFKERYGIEVRAIEVKDINPPEEYRKATLAKFEAAREKERIEITAEAERTRIDRVYGSIKRFKDLGRLVRALEAMEKSPLAASITVQAIPGIQELFRGLFGRTPEETSHEEIKKLRKAVEEIKKRGS